MVIAYNFSYDLSFPINTSCNWKVETVAENPNNTNQLPCTLAVKVEPLVLPLATKLVIQHSPSITNF